MSRNFELMTQLGLQAGATEKPKPDATESAATMDGVSNPPGEAGNVREEEMARFILEIFSRGGNGPKQ